MNNLPFEGWRGDFETTTIKTNNSRSLSEPEKGMLYMEKKSNTHTHVLRKKIPWEVKGSKNSFLYQITPFPPPERLNGSPQTVT